MSCYGAVQWRVCADNAQLSFPNSTGSGLPKPKCGIIKRPNALIDLKKPRQRRRRPLLSRGISPQKTVVIAPKRTGGYQPQFRGEGRGRKVAAFVDCALSAKLGLLCTITGLQRPQKRDLLGERSGACCAWPKIARILAPRVSWLRTT